MKYSRIYIAFPYFIFVIAVIVKNILIREYFNTEVLLHDDSIYIPKFHFETVDLPNLPRQEFYYAVIQFLVKYGISYPKLLLVAMPLISGFFFIKTTLLFTENRILAAVLAVVTLLYPVAPDQSFFVSGAHPLAALTIFLIFLYFISLFFIKSMKISNNIYIFSFFVFSGFLLVLCYKSSPTFILAPFMLLPVGIGFILIKYKENKFRPIHILYIFLSLLPIVVFIVDPAGYHYSKIVGWTNYSISQIFTNLINSSYYVFVSPFRNTSFAVLLSLLIPTLVLLIVIVYALNSKVHMYCSGRSMPVGIALFLILSSAITFGPSSILTGYRERYVIAPFVIIMLAFSILLASVYEKYLKNTLKEKTKMRLFSFVGNLCLIFTVTLFSAGVVSDQIRPFIESHKIIKNTISSKVWKDDDQILLVLPEGMRSPTNGFNHWSTWYLRAITSNKNIIGLIGEEAMTPDLIENGVFVNKYRDHANEFWAVKNGRSRRLKMLGLEKNRSTYAFVVNSNGVIKNIPILLSYSNSLVSIFPGSTLYNAKVGSFCDLLSDVAQLPIVKIEKKLPLNLEQKISRDLIDSSRNISLYTEQIKLEFIADGAHKKNVNVKKVADKEFNLNIEIFGESVEKGNQYNETLPPMPLLSKSLAVYLVGDQYKIYTRGTKTQVFRERIDNKYPLNINIKSCLKHKNRSVLSINDEDVGLLDTSTVFGPWQLGLGYKERYWSGRIKFQYKIL